LIELVSALGLAIALEGALYVGFPRAMRRALASVSGQPDQALRIGGLVALAFGVATVWLVRG
tara:strand:- start:844 stop:1029 length:186 start_codon:yes stop_codon:yes gene_type:complete